MDLYRVIISGGGTGGHIFPAIAIADEIKKRHPEADILFVGALGKMEMERVPKAGYRIIGLPVAGLQRRLTLKNLSFPFKLLKSLQLAKKIVLDYKPQVVIGVGGYASGPIVRSAAKFGVKTVVQEQNSYPGLTNRMLSKVVDKICVAYEGLERFFPENKIVLTGNPIRNVFTETQPIGEVAKTHFGFSHNPTILVVGGSLGALKINEAVKSILPELEKLHVNLLWQTGENYWEKYSVDLEALQSETIKIQPFINEMELAYAAGDVVVSRAGAIALSELSVLGKACVLVPSPYVSEDHQTKNAMALVKDEAAILVEEKDLETKLLKSLQQLIESGNKRIALERTIKSLAKPRAVENIVDEIEKLVI
jgi:UDP-N-acetylglucosamine--N-acetylmuramyl-(pentapeptide) pyrophosphoryl-undecaprenol N-acetylglucosamine transferase